MCLQASYMFPTNIYTSSFDPNLFITNSNKQVQAPERLQAKKKTRTAAESPRPKQVIDAIPIDEVHDIIGPRMSRELQMTAGPLNGYAGASCPTCGDDLGSQVPKSTDFSLAFKTTSDQSEDDKKRTRNAIAACRLHCETRHPDIPLWNAYRRQEQDPDRARKSTTIAALGGILHHCLKAALENIQFEDYGRLTGSKMRDLLLLRVGYSLAHISVGADNYLKNRKIEKGFTKCSLKETCKKALREIKQKISTDDKTIQMDAAVGYYSRNQIIAFCNLFFVERDYYARCPSWLYEHGEDAAEI
jgi:hypothetical protein